MEIDSDEEFFQLLSDDIDILGSFNQLQKVFYSSSTHQNLMLSQEAGLLSVGGQSFSLNRTLPSDFLEKIGDESDSEFFKYFRVSKKTFNYLYEQIIESGKFDPKPFGIRNLDPKVALYIALYYLGHRVPYSEIARHCGISLSATHTNINRVINFLNDLSSAIFSWPTKAEAAQIAQDFKALSNLSGVIGAVDCCHIFIKAPENTLNNYLDESFNYSVHLLAVCDATKKFRFTYSGFPGSESMQKAISFSNLGQQLSLNHLNLCHSDKYHLVGAPGFDPEKYMIVPFEDDGQLSAKHLVFNANISSVLRIIQTSFEMLKARFKRLEHIDADLARIPAIIQAACVVHNVALDNVEDVELLKAEMSSEEPSITNEEEPTVIECSAEVKREQLMMELFNE